MEQVSKNSTGGAAGARGACGWDPPAGRSRAVAGRPLPPGPPRAPGAAFSLVPGCCPLRRNKGNKGTLCPQHPGSVVRGDRGPQHWARTACPRRRRLGRRAGGGEARAVSPVFLREHPEHPEHRGGKARRGAAPLRLEEGAVALCPWCWAPALEGRGAE